MEFKDCLLIVIRASPCLHQQCKFRVRTHAGLCFKMVHSSAITAWLVGFHCGSAIQEKNEAGQKSDDGQKYGRAGEPEQTGVVTASVLRYGSRSPGQGSADRAIWPLSSAPTGAVHSRKSPKKKEPNANLSTRPITFGQPTENANQG